MESRNAGILTYHAKQKHLLEADMDSAAAFLRRALVSNPYYVPAWLALAELKNDVGQKQSAYAILSYVDELTRGLKRWRWEKALVAFQLGQFDMLPSELRYIVGEIPGKSRRDALQLAFTMWPEPDELIRNIGSENIMHLLDYSVVHNLPHKALFFWRVMEENGVPLSTDKLSLLLEMLLRNGEVRVAGNIWRKYFNSDQLLFNGDFTKPFLQRAFGWRAAKDRNFEQRLEQNPGSNSGRNLHYRFKGWDNLDFHHLTQIVPLGGGRTYRLSAELKSRKLTTDQRPFWEVYGYKCGGQMQKSSMVASDQDWTNTKVDFLLPQECAAAVVRLRRAESMQIDSKLAGQLWLKNIAVKEVHEVDPENDPIN